MVKDLFSLSFSVVDVRLPNVYLAQQRENMPGTGCLSSYWQSSGIFNALEGLLYTSGRELSAAEVTPRYPTLEHVTNRWIS